MLRNPRLRTVDTPIDRICSFYGDRYLIRFKVRGFPTERSVNRDFLDYLAQNAPSPHKSYSDLLAVVGLEATALKAITGVKVPTIYEGNDFLEFKLS